MAAEELQMLIREMRTVILTRHSWNWGLLRKQTAFNPSEASGTLFLIPRGLTHLTFNPYSSRSCISGLEKLTDPHLKGLD